MTSHSSLPRGDDGRRLFHHWFPVGCGGVGHQYFTGLELVQVGHVGNVAGLAGGDLGADGVTPCQDFALFLEMVLPQYVALLLRFHRFRARLDHVEQAVDAVLGPLHVHGPVMAGLFAVVLLYRNGVVGEGENILVVDAEAHAVRFGHRHVACHLPGAAGGIDHLDLLAAQVAPKHRPVALLEGGLVHVELVRFHRALHHVFAQPISTGDEDHVAETGLGVEREHHAAGGEIRADHFHDADGKRHLEMVEAIVDAVMDGAIGEQGGEAALAGVEQVLFAANVEVGILLAGEAGRGQILGRGGGAYRHAHLLAVLFPKSMVGLDDLPLERFGQGGGVDDGPGPGATSRQILHIVGIQPFQRFLQPCPPPGARRRW